jgi:hypothetical protein
MKGFEEGEECENIHWKKWTLYRVHEIFVNMKFTDIVKGRNMKDCDYVKGNVCKPVFYIHFMYVLELSSM